jgi:hypothetical protein
MALSKDQVASWADIQALYNTMNAERTKFSLSTIAVPSNPGTMVTRSIADLNSQVNAMSSNKFLTNIAVTGITMPATGDLIAVSPFTRINNTLTNISNTCAFDSFTFNTNNHGF